MMTKHIELIGKKDEDENDEKSDKDGENDIREFLQELINKLRFPGLLSIDGHGFMEDKTGEPVFIYGSPNSTIRLWNGEQNVFLERKVRKKNIQLPELL